MGSLAMPLSMCNSIDLLNKSLVDLVKHFVHKEIFVDMENLREGFKKTVKFGNVSQIHWDPPTQNNLGIFKFYFFIAHLASMSQDQDFKPNWFFPIQKCIN